MLVVEGGGREGEGDGSTRPVAETVFIFHTELRWATVGQYCYDGKMVELDRKH